MLRSAALLLVATVLTSCGQPAPKGSLPKVIPVASPVALPFGRVHVGTARELPGFQLKKKLISGVSPFMGGGETAVPAVVAAPSGKLFVIVAFVDQPMPPAGNVAMSITYGATVANPAYVCPQFLEQEGKEFNSLRAFERQRSTLLPMRFAHPPFAVAFEVDSRTRGGTLTVNNVNYTIEW